MPLTICLAGVAMMATLSLVAAGNHKPAPAADRQVMPVREPNLVYASSYAGIAHIIHVPEHGERHARASVPERDEQKIIPNRDEPGAPRHRNAPRWPLRSEEPPPLQRRVVLSTPRPLADGPSPIRPLPRLGAKNSQADKFSSPDYPAGAAAADLAPSSDQPKPTK